MKETFTLTPIEYCNEIDKLRDKIVRYFHERASAAVTAPVYISDLVYMFSVPTDDVLEALDAVEDSGRRVILEDHSVYIAGKEVAILTVDVKETA